MKKNTITEASIYEAQGLKNEALEIYKNILKNDPENQNAIDAIRRLSGLRSKHADLNTQMLDFFIMMQSDEEINEFKRWLIRI
ncbi:hypothetical protein DU472_02315 [Campylobacter novaezeelandiae]|uniref:Tetratricopeptide repeat protein n=1 Tax=Campylobacter novaezeelandiae TaxID=2267891 RepID=A0A4V2JQP2_9BACT|nr:hypothetical protein [Campylobacter novaezeelandiae]QWU80135.1 hypothetical protein CNZW441b_0818 [Campylobacter novaezeelandiae]TBR78950.1 hypothetical protein DU474_04180 [Campylobacter novaezeelandiae]TBR81549.1 hypothetical protein DU472_02315 [Campylobacter novaezeelandiae]TBR82292.1 hypothetical protein DU473_00185 [Campylobacter novaezeelandiae]